MIKRKGSRNIVVKDSTWNYLVGKKFIDIRGPQGQKSLVPKEQLAELVRVYGCEWDCCEPDCPDNQEMKPAVLPRAIEGFIRQKYWLDLK